jgi:hypothetical protein
MKKSFATFVFLAILFRSNAQLWVPGTSFPGASGGFIDGNTEQTLIRKVAKSHQILPLILLPMNYLK